MAELEKMGWGIANAGGYRGIMRIVKSNRIPVRLVSFRIDRAKLRQLIKVIAGLAPILVRVLAHVVVGIQHAFSTDDKAAAHADVGTRFRGRE